MPQDMFFESFSSPDTQSVENDDLGAFDNTQGGGDTSASVVVFNVDLVSALRQGSVDGVNELEAAIGLTDLAQEQLKKYATDGSQLLGEDQITLVLRTLRVILQRLGIELQLPFRNYETFQIHWRDEGLTGDGSWHKRRSHLESLFKDTRDTLDVFEENRLTKPLTNPVKANTLSWPEVDLEIRELRRKFDNAVTPQDYRALGTNCVGVLEAVGEAVYDSSLDLHDDESSIPKDRPKVRIERFIERTLADEDETVRKLVRSSVGLAHRLKHSSTPSSLMAGVSADNVILLASIVRRIADPTFQRSLDDEAPF